MKTSTEIYSIARHVGEEKAVEYVAKAGFDAWDFSLLEICRHDWGVQQLQGSSHALAGRAHVAFARRLKAIGEEYGIVCNQSHAPFPVSNPEIRSYLKRAIECTAEAGGSICVIHPDNNKGPQENAEMFQELLPFAKQYGVTIATENMWNWDEEKDQSCFAACATPDSFKAHLDAVNGNGLAACLDIGHAEMRGVQTSAVEMIHALGSRLVALHIHDNDRWHDSHQLPFTMKIDFPAVVKALREVGYRGYFTLEANAYLNAYTAETVWDGVQNMSRAARRLADLYEGKILG